MSARKGYLLPSPKYTTIMSCSDSPSGNAFLVDSLISGRNESAGGHYGSTVCVPHSTATEVPYGLHNYGYFPGMGKRSEVGPPNMVSASGPYMPSMEMWMDAQRSCRMDQEHPPNPSHSHFGLHPIAPTRFNTPPTSTSAPATAQEGRKTEEPVSSGKANLQPHAAPGSDEARESSDAEASSADETEEHDKERASKTTKGDAKIHSTANWLTAKSGRKKTLSIHQASDSGAGEGNRRMKLKKMTRENRIRELTSNYGFS
ncbi:hypothetical protein KUCAC02_011000 [Chaenocephalus aceratus]|uniref:Uncharacterized protein n=1 Tax=Chaenocephalus aceratus TaxID=36190 RepID=A0ACB9WV81_CHAAC|nr:hypothetical protein KUCAC02_011000 [Chaenocephalus aceratus]